MAPCLPDTVTAQMRLLWGSTGSSYLGFTERTAGGKRDCRDRQQPTPLARHSSARLPTCRGSVLSPSQRRRLDGLPVSPLPEPATILLSLFLSSNKSLVPAAPQEHSITCRASACLEQLQGVSAAAAGLPSAELAVSTRSSYLTPARRMLSAVQSPQNSVAPPPLTTAAARSPPEKAKPKACNPWGSPFSSTVECRGKPGLSRSCQLGHPLCTVQRVHQRCFTALGPETHNKDAHARDEVMCSPYSHHAWGPPKASQGHPGATRSWDTGHVIVQASPTLSQPSSQYWTRSAHPC